MHDPKWCLFFDFHTMPACPDVGAGFDADAFTDRIKACGVDFIVFPAKCNLGMAYYDTTVGTRHPSLQYDLLGRLVEACRARDIAISSYINVGLSHEQALLHRDWAILTPDGYTYEPDRLDHFFRRMCYNTPYADYTLEMVREIVSAYPVAGLFLDCMLCSPCVGVECVREMKERGMDSSDPRAQAAFGRLSQVRMARRIAEAARTINPDLLLYYNGVHYEDQEDIGTYLEFECLPTGGWGYEMLPVYARYMRNLGKPVINMTGRFHRSWGDFGGIRTPASLEYDCLYGIANGMRTTVGGHMHPRGDLDAPVFDLIEPIYQRLRKLDPWLDGARPQADTAVIIPPPGLRCVDPILAERNEHAVDGAVRMLCEHNVQFDVLSDAVSWEGYRLLVLPDFVSLDEDRAARVRRHLASGGAVIASAWSGLDPEGEGFVLDEWGVTFRGADPSDPAYFLAGPAIGEGIPQMPLDFYERGVILEARGGTDVLAQVVSPYYSRHWDGEHGFTYMPPDKPTGRPAVAIHGNVAVISHAVFTSYFRNAPVPLRQLVANLVDRFLPQPLVRATGIPSFGRVTVTKQPARRMVHLLAYVPERRGASVDMIEEPIELRDVVIDLRLDDEPPARVYLAPDGRDLPFDVHNGIIRATVPKVRGHALVVFETIRPGRE